MKRCNPVLLNFQRKHAGFTSADNARNTWLSTVSFSLVRQVTSQPRTRLSRRMPSSSTIFAKAFSPRNRSSEVHLFAGRLKVSSTFCSRGQQGESGAASHVQGELNRRAPYNPGPSALRTKEYTQKLLHVCEEWGRQDKVALVW